MNNFFIGRESQRFLEHEADAEGGFPIFERIALNAATEGDVIDSSDETELGFEPRPEDINLEGTDVSLDTLKDILGVDKELWLEECAGIREYYAQFGDKLPKKLAEELDALEARLK